MKSGLATALPAPWTNWSPSSAPGSGKSSDGLN
jgi:hypothetical protein